MAHFWAVGCRTDQRNAVERRLCLIGQAPIENASEELLNRGMKKDNRSAKNVGAADRLATLSGWGKLALVDVREVIYAG